MGMLGLTPSTYGSTSSQKNFHTSTTRSTRASSSTPPNFEVTVTMPFAISSDASCSSVDIAFEGDADTTDWMWRFTNAFRSSLAYPRKNEILYKRRCMRTDIGTPSPFPLKRGRMYTCNVAQGLSPELEDPGKDVPDAECPCACKFTVEGADIDEFKTGKWARFPSRCISRETS